MSITCTPRPPLTLPIVPEGTLKGDWVLAGVAELPTLPPARAARIPRKRYSRPSAPVRAFIQFCAPGGIGMPGTVNVCAWFEPEKRAQRNSGAIVRALQTVHAAPSRNVSGVAKTIEEPGMVSEPTAVDKVSGPLSVIDIFDR